MSETYTCSVCENELPLTQEYFYKDEVCKNGFRNQCKPCMRKIDRERYYKKYYKIDVNTYNNMFNKYKGRCWICGKHQSKFKKRLDVDHDHKTGEVRGLLCRSCNIALGHLKNNPLITIKLVKYLKGEL